MRHSAGFQIIFAVGAAIRMLWRFVVGVVSKCTGTDRTWLEFCWTRFGVWAHLSPCHEPYAFIIEKWWLLLLNANVRLAFGFYLFIYSLDLFQVLRICIISDFVMFDVRLIVSPVFFCSVSWIPNVRDLKTKDILRLNPDVTFVTTTLLCEHENMWSRPWSPLHLERVRFEAGEKWPQQNLLEILREARAAKAYVNSSKSCIFIYSLWFDVFI